MPLFILLTCLVCIREGTSNQILGREIGTCHCVARWPNQWLLSRETPFSNVPPSNSCVLVSKGFSSWQRCLQLILVHYFWSCRDTMTQSCVAAARRAQDTVKNNWHKPWFFVYAWRNTHTCFHWFKNLGVGPLVPPRVCIHRHRLYASFYYVLPPTPGL